MQMVKVIAQGDHMPVHLGSMPMAVAAALKEIEIEPGDVVALNDPFAGWNAFTGRHVGIGRV